MANYSLRYPGVFAINFSICNVKKGDVSTYLTLNPFVSKSHINVKIIKSCNFELMVIQSTLPGKTFSVKVPHKSTLKLALRSFFLPRRKNSDNRKIRYYGAPGSEVQKSRCGTMVNGFV